jgi:FkbM family methyltransferase
MTVLNNPPLEARSHCLCKTCAAHPEHPYADAHALVRSLESVLKPEDVAICVCRLCQAGLLDTPVSAFYDTGGLTAGAISIARQTIGDIDHSQTLQAASIPYLIKEHSADRATRDLLTAAAFGGRNDLMFNKATRLAVRFEHEISLIQSPGFVGLYSLFEMIVRGSYKHVPMEVEYIYDLGACIGMAALYFHALYPSSKIICVEPAPPNLHYLQLNWQQNPASIFSIVPRALAKEAGALTLAMSSAPDMRNSSVFHISDHSQVSVCAITLSDVINREGPYGIKLDIEGAEFSLESEAHLLAGAEWIIGELHYGSFTNPADRWLPRLLERHFDVTMQPLRVAHHAGVWMITQEFQAFKKDSLPHA